MSQESEMQCNFCVVFALLLNGGTLPALSENKDIRSPDEIIFEEYRKAKGLPLVTPLLAITEQAEYHVYPFLAKKDVVVPVPQRRSPIVLGKDESENFDIIENTKLEIKPVGSQSAVSLPVTIGRKISCINPILVVAHGLGE